ncbi:MAG: hypothetical protein KC652_26350 [Cyanobacteria bacterium HKST-UBA01]|nr:hypothetical protein [Cyanobacteria bacterium HKST-UBA01]
MARFDFNEDEKLTRVRENGSDAEKQKLLRQLETELRKRIAETERKQPLWDSKPMKEYLDKSVEYYGKPRPDTHKGYRCLPWYACQTPLLDLPLFEASTKLSKFIEGPWAISGNDTSPLLCFLEDRTNQLEQDLADSKTTANANLIYDLRNLLSRTAEDFHECDTKKAESSLNSLLNEAEESGDYRITGKILDYYRNYLYAMYYRPDIDYFQKRLSSYVEPECRCISSDRLLSNALENSHPEISKDCANSLKSLHQVAVKLRREGNLEQAEEKYKALVAAADATRDETSAMQYYALNAYCEFLTGYYSRRKDSHEPLFSRRTKLAVAEELGKQKRLEQENETRGGDWLKLERAFQRLKRKNIVVIRESKTAIANNPLDSLQNDVAKSRPVSGLAYYSDEDPAPIEILEDGKLIHKQTIRLGFQGRLERSKCSHCGHKHIKDNSKANTKKQLLEALKDVGLEAQDTINSANSIEVVGDWSNHSP